MAEYTELIKALRHCYEDDDACATCQRWLADDEWGIKCKGRLISDAAAAIEALQAEVAELKRVNMEIFEDLPKRGEWVGVSPMVDTVQCSVCGGQLFSAELETPYCPWCGAKMEVQE